MQHVRVLLAGGVVVFLIGALLFGDSGITGFVSSQSFAQQVDLSVAESQRFSFRGTNDESFMLTSFSLSGRVEGNGLAKVYLTNGNKRTLVFSNAERRRMAMEIITGMAVSEVVIEPGQKLDFIESVPDEYQTWQGGFKQMCVETCVLEERGSEFYLDVVIDPGTRLHISEFWFTVSE